MLVAGAALITHGIRPYLGESIAPIFFGAVMLAAWYGGLGPGLLATVCAGVLSAIFFPNPALVGWDDLLRLAVFLMIALLISSLTSLRKRAEEDLRQSHEQLEQRVAQRTAELLASTNQLRASNQKLIDSEERFRLLVEGVDDYAIVMLDRAGKVVSWNSGAERILGYRQDEILGHAYTVFFLGGEMAVDGPWHVQIAAEFGRHEDEGWRQRRDGTRFWANVITTALRADNGEPRGFAQVTRDITELRALERQVLEISEAEQRRLGHDLHDGLGQELTGIAYLSQNLANQLALEQSPQQPRAQRLATLIGRLIEQTRELARGFAPVEMEPQGLEMALATLAHRVSGSSDMRCHVQLNGTLVHDHAVALHLYRIAQEAVNNALRHSRGQNIWITLSQNGQRTILGVRDDGVGVDPDKMVSGGIGINVMRYRARTMGGSLLVQRASPSGTEIFCSCTLTPGSPQEQVAEIHGVDGLAQRYNTRAVARLISSASRSFGKTQHKEI